MEVSRSGRMNGQVLRLICHLAQKTARITESNWSRIDEHHQAGRAVLYGTWHKNSMMIVSFMRRWRPDVRGSAIIPDDWRGAALYHWLGHSGILPWPMDLEGKGMDTARRFAELIRAVKKGKLDSYISPDGPSGPSHVVKPGLAFLAQKSGLPIFPLAAYSRPSYTMNRWDAYRIPLPFSRIHVAVGEPVCVKRGEDLEQANEKIRQALNNITLQAEAEFYSGEF